MMRLTVRLHTPPLAFCSFQNIWLACVSGWASGANTPERSVSTPSVIVLSAIPGPVFSDPPLDADDDELEPLLPQPAAIAHSSTASPTAPIRKDRVMRSPPWV